MINSWIQQKKSLLFIMLPCPDPLKNALKCYEFLQSFSGLIFARCTRTHNFNQMFSFSPSYTDSAGRFDAIHSSSHVSPPHQERSIWEAAQKPPAGVTKKSALVCETQRERENRVKLTAAQPPEQSRWSGREQVWLSIKALSRTGFTSLCPV